MPRPKGSKNKPKDAAPGVGHNGAPDELTDEQRQVLAIQHKRKLEAAEAKKDEAVASIRNIRKQIKVDLGADGVEVIKAMMLLETEDGEAKVQAQIERAVRAARWMGLAVGTQADLFADDRTPAVDRARAAGKAARFNGEPMKPPHDPSVPQHDAWVEGWHDGQRALNEAQRRDDAAAFPEAAPIGDQPATYAEAK